MSRSDDPRLLLASSSSSLPPSLAVLPSKKLDTFNTPLPSKRSKVQIQEALDKAKHEREEIEAGQAYEGFLRDFGGEPDLPTSATVSARGRGGLGGFGGGAMSKGKGFVRSGGGGEYVPPLQTTSGPATINVPTGPRAYAGPSGVAPPAGPKNARSLVNAFSNAFAPASDDVEAAPVGKGKKKREADDFLQQLKREQKDREERIASQVVPGQSSLPLLAARTHAPVFTNAPVSIEEISTNLHVSPLPASISESELVNLFSRYGVIATVKLISTASGDPKKVRPISGFVSFQRRPDAERAAHEMDGVDLGAGRLKISWARSVGGTGWSSGLGEETRFGELEEERGASTGKRARLRSKSPEAPMLLGEWTDDIAARSSDDEYTDSEDDSDEDDSGKETDGDTLFEKMMMGVNRREGPKEMPTTLRASDEERWKVILGRVKSTRISIARGSAFALERCSYCAPLSRLLISSLLSSATPFPNKLARLHLLSNLLHSSSTVPSAQPFRATLLTLLSQHDVFPHLAEMLDTERGRLRREGWREAVLAVLDAWELWMIWDEDILSSWKRDVGRQMGGPGGGVVPEMMREMEAELRGLEESELPPPPPPPSSSSLRGFISASNSQGGSGFRKGGFKRIDEASVPDVEQDIDGAQLEPMVGTDDVDGAALDEDVAYPPPPPPSVPTALAFGGVKVSLKPSSAGKAGAAKGKKVILLEDSDEDDIFS